MYGPGDPQWQLTTEPQLALAAAQGLLEETHYLDIKHELGAGRSANKELAKDLASFAVDGGLLIYGVDEDSNPPALSPLRHAGLAERIEQVALAGVTEPLYVRTQVIVSDADPDLGYVLVTVPPSQAAPHMVDGRYYGRSDKTKMVLDDARVTALHTARARRDVDIADVAAAVDSAPLLAGDPVFIGVARPAAARLPLLAVLSAAPDWQQRALKMLLVVTGGREPGYAPSLLYATRAERRPSGFALTAGMDSGRRLTDTSERARSRVVEVTFAESGQIRLMSARAADVRDEQKLIFEKLIIGNIEHLIALSQAIAAESGYLGGWEYAVHVRGLRDGSSWELVNRHAFEQHIYTDDDYSAATSASAEELSAAPGTVARRLGGPLLRALGSDHLPDWQPFETPTTAE